MCNSLAEGGRRCAAHIKAEMSNHEDNYNWEVIKSASESNQTLHFEPLSDDEERVITLKSLQSKEVLDANHDANEANFALNAERNKYSFVLSTRDENQVARYLYENSEKRQELENDLAKAQHAHMDKLKSIDENPEFSEEEKVTLNREALNNYRFIRDAIKNKSSAERNRAIMAAPHALKAYRDGDATSFRMVSGPMQGEFPHSLAVAEKRLKDAQFEVENAKRNAKNKALREETRKRMTQSSEFSEYEAKVFPTTVRGQKYFSKKAQLEREFMLTNTYVKQLDSMIEDAKGNPEKVADLEQHRFRIERIRALDSIPRKSLLERLQAGA